MPWPSVRCPGALKHFRPASPDGGSSESADERLRSSYGNSILYTDHVLAAVIDILQKSDSVTALLYESDHGEDLPTPTCRLIGHGNGTPYDYRVPAFLWYSDAYAKPPPNASPHSGKMPTSVS